MKVTGILSKPCEQCGRAFRPCRSDARFCSQACKQRAYRRRVDPDVGSAARETARQEATYFTKHTRTKQLCCEHCGRELVMSVASTNLRYCSNACKQKAYRARRRQRHYNRQPY